MFGHLVVQSKFAAERPTESARTQKTFDRAFKKLSIDIKFDEIHSIQSLGIKFLAEVVQSTRHQETMAEGYCKVPRAEYFDSGRSNYRRFAVLQGKSWSCRCVDLGNGAVASPWAPTAALPSKALISASGPVHVISYRITVPRTVPLPPLENAAALFPI